MDVELYAVFKRKNKTPTEALDIASKSLKNCAFMIHIKGRDEEEEAEVRGTCTELHGDNCLLRRTVCNITWERDIYAAAHTHTWE